MDDRKRKKLSARGAWIGIWGNAALAMLKIIVGLGGNSIALVADGVHSSSDMLTSIMTLIMIKVSYKPADEEHPYGHGRIETIGAELISMILFITALGLFYSSIKKLFSINKAIPTKITFIIAIISALVKLWMYAYKNHLAKEVDSEIIKADALDHLSDSLTSFAVSFGILLAIWYNNGIFDPIFALMVAGIIIILAFKIFRHTANELMDGLNDTKIYDRIARVLMNCEGVYNPHKIRIRKIGPMYFVDLHIEVEPAISVTSGHDISTRVENRIREIIPNVADVTIHIEPIGSNPDS